MHLLQVSNRNSLPATLHEEYQSKRGAAAAATGNHGMAGGGGGATTGHHGHGNGGVQEEGGAKSQRKAVVSALDILETIGQVIEEVIMAHVSICCYARYAPAHVERERANK